MQFIDLAAQQKRIRKQIEQNIGNVLDHGQYVMGPEITELEKKLADYAGTRHAVACASGTDALLLALMTLGVGPGDAVFTSPFTFIATAEVISLAGATPVFVDIDPETFNMDPSLLESALTAFDSNSDAERPINPGSGDLEKKGVIAVDLFGLPAGHDRINTVAKKAGLFVIEDAAQSFGADYKGKKACSLSDIGCTSFFPAKPLGCYGDGGMCFTAEDHWADVMRSLRNHGQGEHKYENVRIGINGRMDTLQAAVLLAKFELFPEEMALRAKLADRYTALIGKIEGLTAPRVPVGMTSAWAQYTILAEGPDHRSHLQARLREAGVPTAIYYPKPLHLQPAFAGLGYEAGDFPISEDFANRAFSIPMHPYLTEADQVRIAEVLRSGA